MSEGFNSKTYEAASGHAIRLSRNVSDKSEETAKTKRAIFIKTTEPGGRYGVSTFATLSLEDARDFRDHLDVLIDEVQDLLPKVPTKTEFVKALPEGTLFSNGSLEYIRLDKDRFFNKSWGEVRDIEEYFGNYPNDGAHGVSILKIGPVVK